MKAVILAGGEGTRLRPLTSTAPKPLLPIVNRPMMEHIVALLRSYNITDIVVTVGFLSNAVQRYFGDGREFGVQLQYVNEPTPLGTAGSVGNARALLQEPFLVISGDVLTDINIDELLRAHREGAGIATLALKAMENPVEFGVVVRDEHGAVRQFIEKPAWGEVLSDTVNTGIYVIEPRIFSAIPEGEASDFSADIFPRLIESGEHIHGYTCDAYWEDVGTLEAYVRAHVDVLDHKVDVDIPGFALESAVWLGEGCEVHPDAIVEGPAVIGSGTTVEAGARLGAYTVLGSNVRVGADVNSERSVVHDNAYLGTATLLRGSVLGRGVDIRRGVRCEPGVVVGDESFIGEHAVLSAGVKIFPRKEVEHGAVVNSSVVWETRAVRNVFSREGITGLANVDITPELSMRVAMAFATMFKKGSTVTLSRDSSRTARTMSRAISAGLNAAGLNVMDLEVMPIPVARFQVSAQQSVAGLTVRLATDDPESVAIRFFDENGQDISEETQRKIERVYHREDFRRVPSHEIGDSGFPARIIEHYNEALLSSVSLREIRDRKFKVVLDYAYGTTSFTMPHTLSKLNAEVMAVNPFASTKAMLRFDRNEHAARVSAFVQASGADLGAVFDPDGEHIVLIDNLGRVLNDELTGLTLVQLIGQTAGIERNIVALVSASQNVQRIAQQYGLQVVWSKLSVSDLTAKASDPNTAFGLGSEGGFMFPRFLSAYDATSTFVNLLSMLATTSSRLSDIVDTLPSTHIAHETVATPWERKGALMRSMMESSHDSDVIFVEGMKIVREKDWVLILPDPEKPLTHVWAEGGTPREARSEAQRYVRQIRQLLHST